MEKWLQDINAVATPVGYVHPKTGELLKAVRLDIAPAKDSSVGEDKPEEVAQGHKVETEGDPVVSDPVVLDADADAGTESDPVVIDPVAVDADAKVDAPQPTSEPKKRGKVSK